jgi:hypothetical protein
MKAEIAAPIAIGAAVIGLIAFARWIQQRQSAATIPVWLPGVPPAFVMAQIATVSPEVAAIELNGVYAS